MSDVPEIEILRSAASAGAALDSTRQQLLALLREPDSAAGLARQLGLPRQRLNYHLRELEKAGLVEPFDERRKGNCVERRFRATARCYVISPEILGELGPTPAKGGDRASAGYLIGAAGRSIRETGDLELRARSAGQRMASLTLDAEVRFPTAKARAEFAAELADLLTDLLARYRADRSAPGLDYRLTALFHPTASTTTPA